MRIGQDKAKEAPGEQEDGPDSREKGQDYKPEGETAPKAAEALKKGADAARGRGQTLLEGSNVRLNRNIESDMNVHWIKFKNCLSWY